MNVDVDEGNQDETSPQFSKNRWNMVFSTQIVLEKTGPRGYCTLFILNSELIKIAFRSIEPLIKEMQNIEKHNKVGFFWKKNWSRVYAKC